MVVAVTLAPKIGSTGLRGGEAAPGNGSRRHAYDLEVSRRTRCSAGSILVRKIVSERLRSRPAS